jgi:hypothetical protein
MILSIGIELYIILGALVIAFIVLMYIVPSIKFNNAKKILSKYPNFKEHKKKYYDFTIENEEIKLFIRVLDVPSNSMITINSKDTWVVQWGGSSKDFGRAYPNKKYLDEIKDFLKKEYESEKKVYKIIVINNSTEKIVRYLNESELAVVSYKETIYGYKIFELSKIEEQMEYLGIKL